MSSATCCSQKDLLSRPEAFLKFLVSARLAKVLSRDLGVCLSLQSKMQSQRSPAIMNRRPCLFNLKLTGRPSLSTQTRTWSKSLRTWWSKNDFPRDLSWSKMSSKSTSWASESSPFTLTSSMTSPRKCSFSRNKSPSSRATPTNSQRSKENCFSFTIKNWKSTLKTLSTRMTRREKTLSIRKSFKVCWRSWMFKLCWR